MSEWLLPIVLLPGLGRRVSGGVVQQWTGYDTGDVPVRLFFGATCGIVALAAGAVWWQAMALWPLAFLTCSIGMFGGIAIGRSGNPWWRDVLGLEAHALLGWGTILVVAWWLGDAWWWLAGGVASIALVYELGWIISGKVGNPALPLGFRGGSELGELLWGVALGAGIWGAVQWR
jgi:hypothetical protein